MPAGNIIDDENRFMINNQSSLMICQVRRNSYLYGNNGHTAEQVRMHARRNINTIPQCRPITKAEGDQVATIYSLRLNVAVIITVYTSSVKSFSLTILSEEFYYKRLDFGLPKIHNRLGCIDTVYFVFL